MKKRKEIGGRDDRVAGGWCSGGSWKGFQSKGLGWAGLGWPTHPSRGWRGGLRHDLVGARNVRPLLSSNLERKTKKKTAGKEVLAVATDRVGAGSVGAQAAVAGIPLLGVGEGWWWTRVWGGFGGWWAGAGRKRVWAELGPSSAGGKLVRKRKQKTRVEHIGCNAFTKPTTAMCH